MVKALKVKASAKDLGVDIAAYVKDEDKWQKGYSVCGDIAKIFEHLYLLQTDLKGN